jgi:hypothetical protein
VKTIGMLLLAIVVGLGLKAAYDWQAAEKSAGKKPASKVAQNDAGAPREVTDLTQANIQSLLGAPKSAENRGGDVSWYYEDVAVHFFPNGQVRGIVSTKPGRELDTFVIEPNPNGGYQLVSRLPDGGYRELRPESVWNRTPKPTPKRWGSALDRKAY